MERPDAVPVTETMSVTETAKTLDKTPATIRRYVRDGVLVGRKVGPRVWHITRKSVEAQLVMPE